MYRKVLYLCPKETDKGIPYKGNKICMTYNTPVIEALVNNEKVGASGRQKSMAFYVYK